MNKKLFSTAPGNVTADQAFRIAQAIGQKDFRTAISRYATGDDAPWIVSVSHGRNIGRFAVAECRDDASEAELRHLPDSDSHKDVVNIMSSNRGVPVMLSEMLTGGFIGINKMLENGARKAA